jgi:hypothetical protein
MAKTAESAQTDPELYYQASDESLVERQGRLDNAFNFLFEEVLRIRSSGRNEAASTDSTPAGGQE